MHIFLMVSKGVGTKKSFKQNLKPLNKYIINSSAIEL